MISPFCTVNGADPADGVDVAAGANVTIQLVSLAGVESWSIACFASDESTDPTAITASLSINQLTGIATFTAPSAGKSMLFQSLVNGDESNSATFLVCVPTLGGKRVLAAHERLEGNVGHGWLAAINSWLRGL